ncbi:MAG: DUF3106 domain-containing protein [Planctomycetota bacterium]|nr:DUF3106 domain-containing protein [Planctomycetota bacterium]
MSRWFAGLFLILAVGVLAQSSAGYEDQSSRERLVAGARSWKALTPERRAELRRRFSELQGLKPEEKTQLRRLAKRLQNIEEDVRLVLDESARKRLAGLDRERRTIVMGEMVAAEASSEAKAILRRMPEKLQEDLQGMLPKERRAALAETRNTHLESVLIAASQHPARLGFSKAEAQRLLGLDKAGRRAALLLALKAKALLALEAQGDTERAAQRRYERLAALDPEGFARAFMRYSRDNPEVLEKVLASRFKGKSATFKLRRALEPRPAEYLEFADEEPSVRRRKVNHRKRLRTMKVLRKEKIFSPKRLEELEQASDREVLRAAERQLARQARVKKQN